MLVWTVQPKTALDDINNYGSFRCEEKKSFNLSKKNSLITSFVFFITVIPCFL